MVQILLWRPPVSRMRARFVVFESGAVAARWQCVFAVAGVLGLLSVAGCASPATTADPPATLLSTPFDTAKAHAVALPSMLPGRQSAQKQALYSLSVEGVRLDRTLRSIAAEAGLQLVLGVTADQRITTSLVDQPLSGVLDVLSAFCDCRYQISGGRLSVLNNAPYSKSYSLDYLNIKREIVSNLAIATRVGNLSAASDGSDNRGNASRTGITSRATVDVWESLDLGLRGLLQIESKDPRVQINAPAGLVVVHATDRDQRLVADYLALLQSRLRRQVSIEAQVIEIDLNEHHAAGVDWQQLASADGLSFLQSMSSGFSAPTQASGAVLQYTREGSSSSTRVLVNLLQQFGDVRVISAPRVVALNNQPSVLSVVENKVYFSSSISRKSSTEGAAVTESVETAIHTVPVGLVMQMTPQVSIDGDVVLSIRPTISRVSAYVTDPNPALAAAGIVSRVPEIQVREMETVLRVGDGETIVLGGMMQIRDRNDRSHVPLLHKLPLIGALFRSKERASRQAELLVLLTPTVVVERKL